MDALFGICTAMLKSEKHYSQVVEFGIVSSNRVTLLEKLQVLEGKIIIGTKIMLLKDLWCVTFYQSG